MIYTCAGETLNERLRDQRGASSETTSTNNSQWAFFGMGRAGSATRGRDGNLRALMESTAGTQQKAPRCCAYAIELSAINEKTSVLPPAAFRLVFTRADICSFTARGMCAHRVGPCRFRKKCPVIFPRVPARLLVFPASPQENHFKE